MKRLIKVLTLLLGVCLLTGCSQASTNNENVFHHLNYSYELPPVYTETEIDTHNWLYKCETGDAISVTIENEQKDFDLYDQDVLEMIRTEIEYIGTDTKVDNEYVAYNSENINAIKFSYVTFIEGVEVQGRRVYTKFDGDLLMFNIVGNNNDVDEIADMILRTLTYDE